ncbi:hypothetical protein [Cohnella candidum]|uniref:Uncharacterized protein n=1 Tax=Cohnella candidum TaxID=2674991 RepID=A0A3G3K1Y8_9BACL|nr:hypothetical protein [Cohnella candidum]AYQ74526.1 hypothetical protein EAV92_19305 [Cohnella candidum]
MLAKLRVLGSALTAALPTGILFGILLRLNMRIIALARPEMASGFHWSSTLMIIMVGTGMTLASAIVYAIIGSRLPVRQVRRAAAYGAVNLLLFGAPFLLSNPSGELFGSQAAFGVPLFAAGFFLQGMAIAAFAGKVERWANSRQSGRFRLLQAAGIVLAIPALVMLGAIVYEYYTEMLPALRQLW